MFLLKKIISPLFSPLTVCLGVQLLGLALLWFKRKRRPGLILVSIGTLTMVLLSYAPVPNTLLGFLEHRYPAFMMDVTSSEGPVKAGDFPKWIVVLGGGIYSDPSLPTNSQLSNGSLSRLIEAIRIHKIFPETKFLIAGGPLFGQPSDSDIMAKVAQDLGVSQEYIILVSDAKDTNEQARKIRNIVGGDVFILVTSAYHMPRALALLRKLGTNPIPAPTGYFVRQKKHMSPGIFFPNASALRKVEIALHEYLGIIWAKMRNQI